MTHNDWLKASVKSLEIAGIDTARLDAVILLEHVTQVDRAKLLAEPDTKISSKNLKTLNNLLKRRISHEPIAYIIGHVEFYSRTYNINEHVLVPRPESETMIDELIMVSKSITQPTIADVGTGSGALGITAKLELPNSQVYLIDIDNKALKVAKTNVDKFTLPIQLIRSDLLSSFTPKADILLCNLPYIPDEYHINIDASHEPKLAIFAGPDGLDLYRRLFKQLDISQNRPLYLLCESLPSQHNSLQLIANTSGYNLVKTNDFIQVFECTKK